MTLSLTVWQPAAFRWLRTLAKAIMIGIIWLGGVERADATNENGRVKQIKNGVSPDGKWEIVCVRERADDQNRDSDAFDAWSFVLRPNGGSKGNKVPLEYSWLAFKYATDFSEILWHSSSRFFAITHVEIKRFRGLYLFEVDHNHKPQALRLPDFGMNALGRVDAVNYDRDRWITLTGWKQDLLTAEMKFSSRNSKGNGGEYSCDVELRLDHGESTETALSLEAIKNLKEANLH